MKYTSSEITAFTGGELKGPGDTTVDQVVLDSRTVFQPGRVLYIAIRGERHDGHDYIADLAGRGVRAFMVEKIPGEVDSMKDISFILVDDTLKALQKLAARHRSQIRAGIIGITGSNGKTVVKEWIYQALSHDRKVTRSPKSYNSQVGVPLSVLLLEEDTGLGVFEAGISQPGEMEVLEGIIRPNIGIFTNIGQAHQEGFRDLEEKIYQKLQLFSGTDVLIYCRDHTAIDRAIRKGYPEKKCFAWSAGKDADLRLLSSKQDGDITSVELDFGGNTFNIAIPFSDRASVENAMHVICLLLWFGYEPLLIESRIGQLTPVAMRLEMIRGTGNCTLINDSYNSDLVSLSIALDYLNQQNQHTSRALILSDIYQSGRNDESLYREVADMLKAKRISRFIGIGPAINAASRFFPGASMFYRSTREFLEDLPNQKFSNEAILIKGSRSFAFETIAYRLQEKNHETVLEIDLNAMIHNLNVYRSLLPADTKIMAMVKAFSYGSGSHEVANALQYQRIDYLCVAYVDEGISLRTSGIHLPILVMNPEIGSFGLMLEHQLEPEIYNFRSLFSFLRILEKSNLVSCPVHLKLDTGMHRLGFLEEELDQLIEVLKKNESLHIQSVFSHLAAADEGGHDRFTRRQLAVFERMSGRIMNAMENDVIRHILNTAGIERFPEAAYDMVRVGIGLYGISCIMEEQLLPVSTLRSTVSQVKPVAKGESVGYNRNYIACKDMLIGIVPVGYADGIRRDLGTRDVSFLVRGREVKVLGNLCMDMCFVDLTGTEASEGDEVIIFGRDRPVGEFASRLDTIPYEVLAGLSERIKRVYYHE